MHDTLRISGSSFLIPDNKNWGNLKQKYKVVFTDYGNWSSALLGDDDEINLIVICIEDFIPFDVIDGEKPFYPLLSLVASKLKKSEKEVIVCIASNNNSNLLRRASKLDQKSHIHYWLISEFEFLAAGASNLFIVDLDREFSMQGKERCFDKRNWYFAHCRFSSHGLGLLSVSVERVLNRLFSPASKVLVLDCDNTIWGGVIGEDGIDGIQLGQDGAGQIFVDFQKQVKQLLKSGTIIVLASKNDEDAVWNVFDNHQAMILKRDDIVAWKINWADKTSNIQELSKELALGLDSFVFWDDNPLERHQMESICPYVKTIDVPKEIYRWPEILEKLDCFAKLSITADDFNKVEQYKGRANFVRDNEKVNDKLEYLRSIKLNPSLVEIDNSNISRASQLCFKTNQFNLTSKRLGESDISTLIKSDNNLSSLIHLDDIYGDHGLVAFFNATRQDVDYLFIDTFLMSCRVIGRNLEAWILHKIAILAIKKGYKFLIGEYIQSDRNSMCKNFYLDNNFRTISQDEIDIANSNHVAQYFLATLSDIKIPNIEAYLHGN